MKVIVAEHFGIVSGVRDAIAQAQALPGKPSPFGPAVRNPSSANGWRSGRSRKASEDAPPTSARRLPRMARGQTSRALRKSALSCGWHVPAVRYAPNNSSDW